MPIYFQVRDELSLLKPKEGTIKKSEVERAGISLNCVTSKLPKEVEAKNNTAKLTLDAPNQRHSFFTPEEEL